MNRFHLTLCFLMLFIVNAIAQQNKSFILKSPNGLFSAKIEAGNDLSYIIKYRQQEILKKSVLAMDLGKEILGKNELPTKCDTQKNSTYNQLLLNFKDQYTVVFRFYNEGFAYRFITNFKDSLTVVNEIATFGVQPDASAVLQETNNYTSWEGPYVKSNTVAAIQNGKRATTPALFACQNEVKLVIAESDLMDYPGMYVVKTNEGFSGEWAKLPSKSEMGSWGNFVSVVKERYPYIAKTVGKREFPWRVAILSTDDKQLLTNNLITALATPSKLTDTSWIKPGKATWEWWHDAILPGATIPSGMDNRNTALYKYYIDFAAANKLEYLMVDAGWANNYDIRRITPKNDIKEVIAYGKSKKVNVFLWCVASTLLKDLDKNLDFVKSIGAVGLKVDFIDRDDQEAIKWFEIIAKAAAKRKLMIDFHGCSKPTGLEKTYPNIINYEAVRGAESDKWDYSINPELHLLLPFIRQLAGPFDYTPGAMRNKTKDQFKPIDPGLPSGQGTRCHELAMFVIFKQPFAMLADSPTAYEKEPEIMKFLSAVPTVFDQSLALSAKLGEEVLMAKRKGEYWFVGGMTNWDERDVVVDFSFLDRGKKYTANVYVDGPDANNNAVDFTLKTITITDKTKLPIKMAKGGGFVIYIN